MGAAVACNLRRNGVPTVLYDLAGDANVPVPLQPLMNGAEWAGSAAEAAAKAGGDNSGCPRPGA